ncbi:MAG: hypothetical protein LLG42_11530, partial [Chloroflexi bacterium]|nr:hypothetical protein [Chloroflexota bacterium]
MFPHPAHSSPVLGRMLRCAQHDNAGCVSTPSPFITGSWADASLPLSMTTWAVLFPPFCHSERSEESAQGLLSQFPRYAANNLSLSDVPQAAMNLSQEMEYSFS